MVSNARRTTREGALTTFPYSCWFVLDAIADNVLRPKAVTSITQEQRSFTPFGQGLIIFPAAGFAYYVLFLTPPIEIGWVPVGVVGGDGGVTTVLARPRGPAVDLQKLFANLARLCVVDLL